ncbi:hypothetical protein C0991_007437 [Blastosporella zonata]|nr:hypothetical protein C0991_007437 [Blastosporella zonata]
MLGLRILLLLISVSASIVLGDRLYTIKNSCPTAATLFINGVAQGSLPASGGVIHKNMTNIFDGFIYTDANGGNQNGAGTTRAGFYGDNSYYYIVVDPAYFNVGVTITPRDQKPQPPTAFPPPTSTPPSPPVFSCPQSSTGYTVEFCPGGAFPPPPTVTLHPNGNAVKCLDVRGAVYANGTPVQMYVLEYKANLFTSTYTYSTFRFSYDCNGTGAQKWQLQRGSTKVRVAGTNLCLDAGSGTCSI